MIGFAEEACKTPPVDRPKSPFENGSDAGIAVVDDGSVHSEG